MPPESSFGRAPANSAQTYLRQRGLDQPGHLRPAAAAQTQRQVDVFSGGGPGQQRGVLEHEPHIARSRLLARVPLNMPGTWRLQPGEQAQQRGLAAA